MSGDPLAWLNKFVPPPPPKPIDMSWLDKFAPHVTAPTEQTVSTAVPTSTEGTSKGMELEDIILGYNNGLSNFAGGLTVWPPSNASAQVLSEGVLIHKITLEQAAAISTRIKYSLGPLTENLPGIDPLSYALACLAIESTLDPLCQNANTGYSSTGVARSNPTNNPMLYDMGVAQLKLEYIQAPGVVDHDSALAFALDVDKAIPYFVSLMSQKLLWAQNIIERNTSSAPDSRMNNPLILATNAYNFGETGCLTYYENGTYPSHGSHVVDLERYFATKRGVPSVFPSDF